MFKNLLANIIGKLWNLLSIIIFTPFYIKFLDFDSYSIISFSVLLYSIITLLNAGMSASFSRELARKDVDLNEKIKTFDTLKTTYLFLVLTIIILVLLFSDLIITNFIKTDKFSLEELRIIINIIGFGSAFQILFRFLNAGLIALEKQILANKLLISWGIFRNAFVLILIYFYPSVEYFFIWQALITLIFSAIALYYLTVTLKGNFNFILFFDINTIKRIWKFTAGMFLISLISVLTQQSDKLILSNLVSINELGYYSLAFTLSILIVSSVSPFAVTMLPKLTAYFSEKNYKSAISLYTIFQKISLTIIFSISVNFIFFQYEILFMWLDNTDIAKTVSLFISFILMGYTFMAISVMPFNVAIANGYTVLNIRLGFFLFVITTPLYYILINKFGTLGAAYVFCFGQLIYILIFYYIINKKFLKLNFNDLILNPIIKPLIICVLIVLVLKSAKPYLFDYRMFNVFYILFSIFSCLIITTLSSFKISELKSLSNKILNFEK